MDFLLLSEASSKLWERFQEGRLEADTPPVVDRWARVRDLGVAPQGLLEIPLITAPVLKERRQAAEDLVAAAESILAQSAGIFAQQHYTLLLSDPAGVILGAWAGGEFNSTAQKARLIAGADWSEKARGTNAIGTALAEARPVAVEGCAHYAQENHRLACYGHPVFGPSGELVGLVDATSFSEAASIFVATAVAATARALQERLRLLSWERTGIGAMTHLLDRLGDPAVVVDSHGEVHFANQAAQRLVFGPQRPTLWAGPNGTYHIPGRGFFWAEKENLGSNAQVIFLRPQEKAVQPARPAAADPFDALLGQDQGLVEAKNRARRFASSDLPVLLLAETGTGKELLARAIHQASRRNNGPFVALNCGALSAQLLESELFGYAEGSFTGAKKGGQAGKLEGAHSGTLFLDEIAEMPAPLQAMLLRVLENGSFYRVGELEARQVDLRLVCATCRDLEAMVKDGRFRNDLFFRIRGAILTLPPLRARTDLLELAENLLISLAQANGRWAPELSPEAKVWLNRQTWSGNVRELKSALAHALVLADEIIYPEHFPAESAASGPSQPAEPSRDAADKNALLGALQAAGGNLSQAARILRVARSTLYRMMDKYGLPR